MSNLLDMYINNTQPNQINRPTNKEVDSMNPVSTNVNIPTANQTTSTTSVQKQNIQQDTFEKKDKTKKTIKYGAIGAGFAALAYGAFALIKYGKTSSSPIEALKEPVKVLTARINPNGFKPSVSIEEDKDKYVGDIGYHLSRLKENQKKKFINNLYSKTNFTEQARQKFIEIYGEYLER